MAGNSAVAVDGRTQAIWRYIDNLGLPITPTDFKVVRSPSGESFLTHLSDNEAVTISQIDDPEFIQLLDRRSGTPTEPSGPRSPVVLMPSSFPRELGLPRGLRHAASSDSMVVELADSRNVSNTSLPLGSDKRPCQCTCVMKANRERQLAPTSQGKTSPKPQELQEPQEPQE